MHSQVPVLFEEGLDDLGVHAVVHVRVELEGGRLELLVAEAAVVYKLRVLLIVVRQSRHLAALPVEMTHVGAPVDGHEEEEAVHQQTPLADVFELDGVSGLHHCSLFIYYKKFKSFKR